MQDLRQKNLLMADIRSGKRKGSVVSAQTFDTAVRNDRETWEGLRRELEDIGISPRLITEKRQYIIAWFQEAVAMGKLGESASSDDDSSAASFCDCESNVSATLSDRDSSLDQKWSSTMRKPCSTKVNRWKSSLPHAQRSPWFWTTLVPPLPLDPHTAQVFQARDRQFLEAARDGNVQILERLLDKGVCVEVRTKAFERNGALLIAAKYGREKAVRLLLFNGADVHAKTPSNAMTALHHAARKGHEKIARLLLESEARIDSQDRWECAPLFHAASKERLALVQLLLDQGADVDIKNCYGDTVLVRAASKARLSVMRLLLEEGADVETKNRHGDTVLMLATSNGRACEVQPLLENGADVETKNSHGDTALMWAAGKAHLSVIQLLLEEGADIDTKNRHGDRPLMVATINGHTSAVQLLLENDADMESKNCHDERALMIATRFWNMYVVRLLLDKGARAKARDKKGRTAGYWARKNGDAEMSNLLRNAK